MALDRLGLTFSGWGRKTFIDCILRQQRDDIEPTIRNETKKMYNILNLQRQPMCNNNTTQNRGDLIDSLAGRQDTHTQAGGCVIKTFRFMLLSRLDSQGLHAKR